MFKQIAALLRRKPDPVESASITGLTEIKKKPALKKATTKLPVKKVSPKFPIKKIPTKKTAKKK